MSFPEALHIELGTSPTRARSGEAQISPTKKFNSEFQVSSPGKIFKGSQVKIEESSSVFSEDPLLMKLNKQLQGTIDSFDNKMQQVLHKQEHNFLSAYKGVVRDVVLDLKHYQGELEKTTEEYKESENAFLKQEMISFREEIKKVVEINKALDVDNKKLQQMIISLKEELKSEKDIVQRAEEEKKALQNLCDSLRESLSKKENKGEEKTLPQNLRVQSDVYNPHSTYRSIQMASQALLAHERSQSKTLLEPLGHESSTKDKFGSRLLISDRNQIISHEFNLPGMTKRSRSPNDGHPHTEQASYLKTREFKYLADTVSETLRKKILEEDDIKMLTDKIVYSASLFLRQKVKEVKVLKEAVERLQRTMEQRERMVDRSFESVGDYQKNESKMLREVFRECVEESMRTLLNDKMLLTSSVELLDLERKNEVIQRVKLFEKYLNDPRVVPFLESIFSERPIEGVGTSKDLSNLNIIVHQPAETSTVEDSRRIKYSEGFGSGRKVQETGVSDSRSISDASTHWNYKAVHQFSRSKEPSIKVLNNNESTSELLSDKRSLKKQSLTPIYTQPSSISTQGRELMQMAGSQMFPKHSRPNGNGNATANMLRGRTKISHKNDLSFSHFNHRTSPNVSVNEDNSLRLLGKSPFSRRILVKNGKLVLNPI